MTTLLSFVTKEKCTFFKASGFCARPTSRGELDAKSGRPFGQNSHNQSVYFLFFRILQNGHLKKSALYFCGPFSLYTIYIQRPSSSKVDFSRMRHALVRFFLHGFSPLV